MMQTIIRLTCMRCGVPVSCPVYYALGFLAEDVLTVSSKAPRARRPSARMPGHEKNETLQLAHWATEIIRLDFAWSELQNLRYAGRYCLELESIVNGLAGDVERCRWEKKPPHAPPASFSAWATMYAKGSGCARVKAT